MLVTRHRRVFITARNREGAAFDEDWKSAGLNVVRQNPTDLPFAVAG